MIDLSKQLALAVPFAAMLAIVWAVATGRARRGDGDDPLSDADGGGDAGDGGGGD